jgi:hypothetical protein
MKQEILQLIKESKPLLRNATLEQKIKLLKLIKESIKLQQEQKRIVVMETTVSDYIEEK